ncbi:META domain-containing protein [Corynebacterium auriscanis]|uniref:META domain-containing protein n=1 Tax=Corynebacterium auriscanis TaxID=99807 RepID=UPI003CF7B060
MTFEGDGSLSGSDGCNLLTRSGEENAGTVTLDMATTLKYCEGIDSWLSTAETAKLSNSEFVFFQRRRQRSRKTYPVRWLRRPSAGTRRWLPPRLRPRYPTPLRGCPQIVDS